MKIFKFSIVFLCITFAIGFVATAAMIIKQNMVDIMINDNVSTLIHNVKYRDPVKLKDVPLIKQKISSGYACIEMLSEYLGDGGLSAIITEETLLEKNGGRITASTINGIYEELKKQFPGYKVTQHKNLKNTEMIDKIYESLKNGMPVIFSYAAIKEPEDGGEGNSASPPTGSEQGKPVWALHYGVAVGIDIAGGKVTVNNPYGFAEIYNLNEFLKATRFDSYENMEFFLRLGFAAELYAKNTVYIFEKIETAEDLPPPDILDAAG